MSPQSRFYETACGAIAPAKLILTGEHFVVHGAPGLSCAVDLYSRAAAKFSEKKTLTIKRREGPTVKRRETEAILQMLSRSRNASSKNGCTISIASEIPIAAGLGSSASIAASCLAAYRCFNEVGVSRRIINHEVFLSERVIHGNPSGIDQATIVYGGAMVFRKGKSVRRVAVPKSARFIVADTGYRHRTGKLVRHVAKSLIPRRTERADLLREATWLTVKAARALEESDISGLGEAFIENQKLLDAIGVTHRKARDLLNAAMDSGASGAKVTGAGGGGCILAVAEAKDMLPVLRRLATVARRVYVLKPAKGLRWWRNDY